MTIKDFEKLRGICREYCELTETGSRIARNKTQEMIAETIKNKSSGRHKNSVFVVYTRRFNYGTMKYPDLVTRVEYENLDRLTETEKTFKRDGLVINKTAVIGYLSK